jgi:hypothetical protein
MVVLSRKAAVTCDMSTLKIVINSLEPLSGGCPATDELIVPYGVG